MDKLVIPDVVILKAWLEQLDIVYYECDNCDALHLYAAQTIDGLLDAKLDIIDNTLICSASAIIRPSVIMSLMSELNQINASTLTTKLFIDIQDDNLPRLIVCQAVSVINGFTRSQFHGFIIEFEDQIMQIMTDIKANHLLLIEEKDEQEEIAETYINQLPYQLH